MKFRLITIACALHLLASCNLTKHAPTSNSAAKPAPTVLTPSQALAKLKQGNARFAEHHQQNPNQGEHRLKELVAGQHPVATLLSCSDSRVPPEIVFDQGLGDLFVVREAGHVADEATLGSIEYAVEHLKTPLIVVMGHGSCGAVTAAVDANHTHKPAEGNIQRIVEDITPAVKAAGDSGSRDSQIARAVTANVKLVMKQIKADPALAEALREGKLKIVGAVYDLHSGSITWL